MSARKHKAGWTLLECMIVVSIIGLAALIAVPTWMAARTRSQTEVCKNNQRLVFEQMNIYCLDLSVACTVNEFPDITSVKNILIPAAGAKYIKRPNAFQCPANPVEEYDDYGFVRDGVQIIDVICVFSEAHNDD